MAFYSYLVSIHTPTKGVTNPHIVKLWRTVVSIHTPTKGVTVCRGTPRRHNGVSIHTPTKGVTCLAWYIKARPASFNPHTHEGCDIVPPKSIAENSGFNPHTHEGCDGGQRSALEAKIMFQSTHPRRV